MALSPQEQAELESLRAELSPSRKPSQVSEMDYSVGGMKSGASQAPSQKSSLSKEEEAELMSLRQEFSAPQQTSSLMDRAQTQLESFGNAVTLGYLPQIQAGFEKVNNFISDPSGGVDAQLEAQGFQLPKQDYVNLRDENIKRQQGQGERNPYDSAAGTVGGILVQAPLIAGAAIPRAAGMAGRVASSVATGFGLGAASNPGDTEGQVSPLQGQDRLTNAAMGGFLGAGGQLLGEGVAKTGQAIRNAPSILRKLSQNTAFKATGAMLKDFRAAFGQNSADEIGETLLNKGIVQAGDTIETIAQKSSVAKKEVGKVLGDTYKETEEILKAAQSDKSLPREWKLRLKATEIDGNKIALNSKGKMLTSGKNDLANSEITAKAQAALDKLKERGKDLSMTDLLEIKTNLDGDINYSKRMQENPIVQQQLKSIRDTINKTVQDRVRVAGGVVKKEGLIDTLKQANKEYGHLATAQRTAVDKASRMDANNFLSLTDKIAGSAVAAGEISRAESPEDAAKAIIKGGLIALTSKYGKAYGPAFAAKAAQKLANNLKVPAAFAEYGKPLIEAAKRSPQEFQALLNQFGKEPEFIKLVKPLGAR